ncbi:MAG: GyrI-like domain-containing protein [Bacteroidota bacterium]
MQPRIETLTEKKLIGKSMEMSFSNNKTGELWRSFMPVRKEIQNSIGSDFFSAEVYPPLFFKAFDPDAVYEKWAAIEVPDFKTVPEGMKTLTFPGGLYAVFVHKGPASHGPETYRYIFGTWLTVSEYLLDDRPHFAVMGAKYKHEDPDSEEEIWIPIKQRS